MTPEEPFGWTFIREQPHRRNRRVSGAGAAVVLAVLWVALCCGAHELVSWLVD